VDDKHISFSLVLDLEASSCIVSRTLVEPDAAAFEEGNFLHRMTETALGVAV
jgi:hypothetical protein